MHQRINFKLSLLTLLSLMLFNFYAYGKLSEDLKPQKSVKESIDDILKKAFNKSMFGSSQGTATLRMILTSKTGSKKERTLSFKARNDNDELKYLIRFEKPADIKGTAFLVKERKGQLPDQYVYIPAAKVVRRVAAGNANSSFFGSDFTYADLLPYPEEKKNEVIVKQLPDEITNGQPVYVAEITPKQAESPYGKLVIFIDKANYITLKINFYNKKNELLKSMTVRNLKKIENQLVPIDIEMKNVQTNSSTEIFLDNINMKANVPAASLTEAAMQRS